MKHLQKELQNLIESPSEGVKVGSETVEGSDMSTWIMDVERLSDTLYDGKKLQISFRFSYCPFCRSYLVCLLMFRFSIFD